MSITFFAYDYSLEANIHFLDKIKARIFLHLKIYKSQEIQAKVNLVCEESVHHMQLLHGAVESPNWQHASRKRTTRLAFIAAKQKRHRLEYVCANVILAYYPSR